MKKLLSTCEEHAKNVQEIKRKLKEDSNLSVSGKGLIQEQAKKNLSAKNNICSKQNLYFSVSSPNETNN